MQISPFRWFLRLLSLFSFLPIFMYAEAPKLGWNTDKIVRQYAEHSQLQEEWQLEVLGAYHVFQSRESIIELGSGNGAAAFRMAALTRLKGGNVRGYDISRDMVAYAERHYPSHENANLAFFPLDNPTFSHTGIENADLITSFSVFHLVEQPDIILKNMFSALRSGGKIIISYPIRHPGAFKEAYEETRTQFRLPMPTPKIFNVSEPHVMKHLLTVSGFIPHVIQLVEPLNIFATQQAFLDWCLGTLPANWRIPEDQQQAACLYFIERFLVHTHQDKLDKNQPLRFPGHRLDIVAIKK